MLSSSLNRSPAVVSYQPLPVNNSQRFPSLREIGITGIENIAKELALGNPSTVETNWNYYTLSTNDEGAVTLEKNSKPLAPLQRFGAFIKGISSPSNTQESEQDRLKATVSERITSMRKTITDNAISERRSVNEKLQKILHENEHTSELDHKLAEQLMKLLDCTITSIESPGNIRYLTRLNAARLHFNNDDLRFIDNEALQKTLDAFISGNPDRIDGGLYGIMNTFNDCSDVLVRMPEMPEILGELCRLLAEKGFFSVISVLVNFDNLLSLRGNDGPWLAAIIRHTPPQYRKEIVKALGEEIERRSNQDTEKDRPQGMQLKAAFITELNKLLPSNKALSIDSTLDEIAGAWKPVSAASIVPIA